MRFVGLLVLLLFLPLVSGQLIGNDVMAEAQEFADEVQEFIGDDEVVIVVGDDISKTEQLMLAAVEDQFPDIANVEIIHEEDLDDEELEGKAVFLVGGPQQNMVAARSLSLDGIEVEEKTISIGVLSYVTAPDGSKYIVLSDKAGYDNLRRTGPSRSPLAKYIPEKYVPAAATAIGFSLIWLWQFLWPIIHKVLRLFISAKIMDKVKKRQWKPKYVGFKIAGIRFKLREWFSIFGAATVFAIAVAYGYISDSSIATLMGATIFINTIVYGIRHFTRLAMDKRHEIHTEYVFWWWGGILVVLTGWLGNTFSLAGYTLSDESKTTTREARIVWTIDLFTFLAGAFFFVWNYFVPSLMVQMAMTLALGIAVIQMLPMKPFGGKKVWEWKKRRWFLTFIPLATIYVIVHIF